MGFDRGTAAAVVVALLWGLSFVAARLVLNTLNPVTLATTRFLIASLIYIVFAARMYLNGEKPSRGDLKDLAALGVLSISLYFWLQYTGVQYAGAGVSAVLVVGLIPILTGVASSIILKEKLSRNALLGLAFGLAGVTAIAYPKLAGSGDPMFFFGAACLMGNAVSWGVYSALSRRLIQKTGKPLMVTAYTTLLGTLALLPLSLTGDWGGVARLDAGQWGAVLYLATFCSAGGWFLWNYALSRLEAVKASVWLYLEPVAAFVGEIFVFGTYPSALTLLGGAAILVGAVLTAGSKKQ